MFGKDGLYTVANGIKHFVSLVDWCKAYSCDIFDTFSKYNVFEVASVNTILF